MTGFRLYSRHMTAESITFRGRPKSRTGVSPTAARELAWHIAAGKTQAEAAKLAGFPDPRRLTDFQRSKDFAAELKAAINDKLSLHLVPKAVKALDEVISDEKINPKIRVDAAKAILDRAGYSAVEVAARSKLPDGDPMETWSIDRLQKFVSDFEARLKEEEAKRAEGAIDVTMNEDSDFYHALQN